MANAKLDRIKLIHEEDVDERMRIVYLYGDIDEDSSKKAIQSIKFLDQTEGDIHIYIKTDGGDWDSGIAIYNTIKECKNRVVGKVLSSCSSMGSVILQACDHRLMMPYSYMLIHPGNAGHESAVPDFLARASWEKTVLTIMYNIYYERMSDTVKDKVIKKKKFIAEFSKDKYIFADQALELGLIDEKL